MLTTAFLGVAHIHTPNFVDRINKREGIQVKAVYDRDADRAQKTAEKLNATVADIDTILNDKEITSVVICSETKFHRELVTRAAEAGKHIFAEKPLATNPEDAAAMREAVEKAGVVFQTGFFRRSD